MTLPPRVSVFVSLPTDDVMMLSVRRTMFVALIPIFPPSDNPADVLIVLFCISKLLPATSGLIRPSPALRKPDDSVVTVLPFMVMVEAVSSMLPSPTVALSVEPGELLKLCTDAEIVALFSVRVVASTVTLPPCPVLAALVSSGAILGWRRYRQGQAAGAPAEANRDVNMDIGETVQVEAWGSDGNASVKYRGALWRAAPAPDYTPATAGPHRIVEVVGSQLIVRKA